MSQLADRIDDLLHLNARGATTPRVPGLAVELLTRAAAELREGRETAREQSATPHTPLTLELLEALRPITWQDVRLAVGEGRLAAKDVLAGANAELKRRVALAQGLAAPWPQRAAISKAETPEPSSSPLVGGDFTRSQHYPVLASNGQSDDAANKP